MVEELHPPQQPHLPDDGGRDPGVWTVSVDFELLHRQKARLVPDLSGLVHGPEGAFAHRRQQLVA